MLPPEITEPFQRSLPEATGGVKEEDIADRPTRGEHPPCLWHQAPPRTALSLAVLVVMAVMATFAPWIATHDPLATDLRARRALY